MHVDVSVAREQAEVRVQAVISAGGPGATPASRTSAKLNRVALLAKVTRRRPREESLGSRVWPVTMGERLRELRQGRGLSLRALAAETGLSAGMLSQLERGVTEPSLATLRKLADVFGQSVSTLFDDPKAPAVWVSKPGERSSIRTPRGRVQYERLTPGAGQLEVLRAVLEPGEATSDEPWSHPSVECVYVVRGTLQAEVDGRSSSVLSGESVTVDSRHPHRYLNAGEEAVEFILAVTPPTP